jgi:hypothetical protein
LKTIDKYVVREHLGPLAFALATLTSLLLLNYIAKQFGNLVGKGLPWSVIGEFFMLSVPFTIAMTLPMAVLVAALYAFSRLAAENEITALKASGVSMSRVVVPVVALAAVLAGFMIAFNDQVLPRANHRLRKLQSDIARKKPTFALREQVINPVVEGRFYLRAGWIDQSSNGMRDVTIFDLSDPLRRRTIYADSGSMAISEDGRALLLTLHSGYMQELPKNSPGQLQRLFYVKDNIRIEGVGNQLERTGDDGFKSDREMSICEMFREHATAERDHAYAKIELREIVLNDAARSLGRPPVRLEREHRTSLSMASVYCRILQLAGAWNPHPAGPDSLQERTRTASAFQVTSALTSAQAAPGKAPPRPDPIRAGTTPGGHCPRARGERRGDHAVPAGGGSRSVCVDRRRANEDDRGRPQDGCLRRGDTQEVRAIVRLHSVRAVWRSDRAAFPEGRSGPHHRGESWRVRTLLRRAHRRRIAGGSRRAARVLGHVGNQCPVPGDKRRPHGGHGA